jgi:hypothetical protein
MMTDQNAEADPNFFTELKTYMKNVNEIVKKLNGSIPRDYNIGYGVPS